MPTAEERLAILDEVLTEAVGKGLLQLDTGRRARSTGARSRSTGEPHVNFGSCSYLGLELDPRMRDAVIDAVTRYGTQFSSSRAYLSSPQYAELEALLDEMFGGHVLVTPTTSLGHLATLPVLVESTDAVLLDHQVHASVQMAANQLRVKGATVELIRHNNMERLEAMIERLAPEHDAHLVHGRRRLLDVRRPGAVRRAARAARPPPAAAALHRRLARRRLGRQARPRPGARRARRAPARDRGLLAEQVLRRRRRRDRVPRPRAAPRACAPRAAR